MTERIHASVCECVCACRWVSARECACAHVCVHTCMHARVHACMCVYRLHHAYIQAAHQTVIEHRRHYNSPAASNATTAGTKTRHAHAAHAPFPSVLLHVESHDFGGKNRAGTRFKSQPRTQPARSNAPQPACIHPHPAATPTPTRPHAPAAQAPTATASDAASVQERAARVFQ